MQHQNKSQQENAAFVKKQKQRGISEAVGDPQKLNADKIEYVAFFVRNP